MGRLFFLNFNLSIDMKNGVLNLVKYPVSLFFESIQYLVLIFLNSIQ